MLFKKLFLLGIKYGPSIMAITCCLKIHLLSCSNSKDIYEFHVNLINWVLNVLLLGMFYIAGKYFNYCWKHQSLCRIALWGYLFYLIFLLSNTPHSIVHPIATMYLIFVILITLIYRFYDKKET